MGELDSKIYKVDKNIGATLAVVYESNSHTISGLTLANNSLWFTFFWEGREIVTDQISKLTNISLNSEVLSTKNIPVKPVGHLSPGVDYLLYFDGNSLGKVRIP